MRFPQATIGIANNFFTEIVAGNKIAFYSTELEALFSTFAHFVKMLFFSEDDATGVSPLGETEEGAAICSIVGQRLNRMQKGINIVGGRKVLK